VLAVEQREQRRLAIQQSQDRARAAQQRNRLGQFATAGPLALEMLQFAQGLLGSQPVRFLDPAIGTGAFYAALLRLWPITRISAAIGFEVDAHYAQPCRRLWRGTPLELRFEDFTAAPAPAQQHARVNLLICNPPYVRHHHLQRADKARLQQRSMQASGVRLSGLAGLYAHFITTAHSWMRDGAIAGWLIPSEFMDVNYGRALKHYLLNAVTLLRVHRYDPMHGQFSDALVSSAIVWLRNRKPAPTHQVEFTYGGSLSRPQARGLATVEQLQPQARWTGYPAALQVVRRGAGSQRVGTPADASASRDVAATTLGDLFRVKRGIATGANAFFIMTAEQAAERGIPRQCLRPILPSARRLESNQVPTNEDGEPLIAHALWLLDCRLPEDQIHARYPRMWRYLDEGRVTIGQGYLCSRRTPWYAQERREPTSFLCTYMARGRGRARADTDGDAGRFIFNCSQAIVANSYLMLYPRQPLARYIGADLQRARRVWQALQGIGSTAMIAGGRVYGGGLYKIEPRELSAMPAPAVAALMQ
jgi:adenine-specific DNA-methyltransferase